MAVDLCRLTTRTMNVNAGHERTSKARIIHQIQLIRGITDALPGLLLAFSHRPKETFPLILNFGATELALPIARVWHRFAGQRNLARQWILQWPEHTATALIPLVFTKPSDNSEAALLALCLLYEQGHGELLQTVANRWQRADVWPALEQLLKQGPMDIYPARIPKAPDFWHPAMWSRPRLITNNQPVTDDALEIIGEMLRFTQGGRFYSGLEQLKTFCQPQTLAAFAWDLFTAWQQAGAPAKDNWAFLALSLFGDESTARDLTTQILAWPQEGKSARAVSGLNILTLMNNDMAAAHLHAMALAQLRGHTLPLRTDWLDAIAGSLIKEALNAPLPWSYRGVIHPDTDPILLTLIDTLAGDGFGKLAPSTPQPPLPKDVTCELERTAISLPAELTLNRFNPMD